MGNLSQMVSFFSLDFLTIPHFPPFPPIFPFFPFSFTSAASWLIRLRVTPTSENRCTVYAR